jgi:hypothetical protein
MWQNRQHTSTIRPYILITNYQRIRNQAYKNEIGSRKIRTYFVPLNIDWDPKNVKVNWSSYSHCVAQRVGRGIALLFHDRDTRRWWVVSSKPRPHFTPGKEPVPILQEAGWAPGPVWTGRKSRPYRDSIPDRPTRSQSLYRLSYPAHTIVCRTV